MKNELIRYIAIPFAIKVFKDDKENFRELKTANVYLDKLEPVIEQLQKDFYKLKGKYHSVRKMDGGKYKYRNELYEFSASELKQVTADIMEEYLFKVKTEHKERIWRDVDTTWKP